MKTTSIIIGGKAMKRTEDEAEWKDKIAFDGKPQSKAIPSMQLWESEIRLGVFVVAVVFSVLCLCFLIFRI